MTGRWTGRCANVSTSPAEGNDGSVMIHLDFNARLVTALREEKLWPCVLEGREP